MIRNKVARQNVHALNPPTCRIGGNGIVNSGLLTVEIRVAAVEICHARMCTGDINRTIYQEETIRLAQVKQVVSSCIAHNVICNTRRMPRQVWSVRSHASIQIPMNSEL